MKIDYEITVDVSGVDIETKKRVQDAFFKLGIKWRFGGDTHLYLEENVYTNKHDNRRVLNYLMWCDSHSRKPTHTINQLFELAGMETEAEPGLIPFNLEKALAGDPVVTRDGREVTQITLFECDDKYPLVAVINGEVYSFTKQGEYVTDHRLENFDLFMKPKTRIINGFEVPAPVVTELEKGDAFYKAAPDTIGFFTSEKWRGDGFDERLLHRGLVFLTKEDAAATAKAMLGINPYEDDASEQKGDPLSAQRLLWALTRVGGGKQEMTQVINGFEVPAPVATRPEKFDYYYVPSIQDDHFYFRFIWAGDPVDKECLERGLVFLTKEDAVAVAKAMLGINPYGDGNE